MIFIGIVLGIAVGHYVGCAYMRNTILRYIRHQYANGARQITDIAPLKGQKHPGW